MAKRPDKSVLFLCRKNDLQSQMCEGVVRKLFPDIRAESAGIDPTQLDIDAILVMRHAEYDIRRYRAKTIEEFAGQSFDLSYNVDPGLKREGIPALPAGEYREHPFPDPTFYPFTDEQELQQNYARVRDEIIEWAKAEFA